MTAPITHGLRDILSPLEDLLDEQERVSIHHANPLRDYGANRSDPHLGHGSSDSPSFFRKTTLPHVTQVYLPLPGCSPDFDMIPPG
jgi:hypothetical protein